MFFHVLDSLQVCCTFVSCVCAVRCAVILFVNSFILIVIAFNILSIFPHLHLFFMAAESEPLRYDAEL